LIVSQFGVNSEWLINGEGEIFTQKNTDERTTRLLSLWTDLPRKYQDVIFGVIDLLRKAKD
jgi:hypothetical protein